jgi:hypothetical protein
MKKPVFSSVVLGTLAVAVGTIAGATFPHLVAAAEPTRLEKAEMDGITAGASLSQTTGASVSGASATVKSSQNQEARAGGGTGVVITGHGLVFGSADGSQTSGRTILSADASGDVHPAGTVGGVVDVPSKTVAYGATWGVAIDLPLRRP